MLLFWNCVVNCIVEVSMVEILSTNLYNSDAILASGIYHITVTELLCSRNLQPKYPSRNLQLRCYSRNTHEYLTNSGVQTGGNLVACEAEVTPTNLVACIALYSFPRKGVW